MNFQKVNDFRSLLRYRPWGILVGVSVSYPTRAVAQWLGESRAYVSNHSFVDMVRSPILPIHIANLSRLSTCTLPITSIPKPLKLSNSQISYPIWQMSILMFAWRVGDNQVELRSDVFLNSYGGWHAITLQWCFHSNKMSIISHSYVSAFWIQSHILCCGLDGTPMFWNGKPAGRQGQCSVLRMRANPGWSTS